MRDEADLSSGQRGAAVSPPPPARHPIALDADLLRWFQDLAQRNANGDHESLINAVLRDYMCRSGEPLERTLRRVLREELRKAG
jgi:uncharacterized protein (DUF4415 family)